MQYNAIQWLSTICGDKRNEQQQYRISYTTNRKLQINPEQQQATSKTSK
jgi:hypothetical protein